MKPLTEPEIRAAFVNCTKGEAERLNVLSLAQLICATRRTGLIGLPHGGC